MIDWRRYANQPAEGAGRELAAALREHLARQLPEYMLPSSIVVLDRLPLTANGKLDRATLAALAPERPPAGDFVEPRTPLEADLAAIWAEVLDLGRVGADDNFFELGGDSIQSIQAIARVNRRGFEVSVRTFFQHPTVATLAAWLAASDGRRAGAGPAEAAPPLPADQLRRVEATAPGAEAIHLLSPFQEHLLGELRSRPAPGLFVVQSLTTLRAPLDLDALRRAWRAVIAESPLFRVSFAWEGLERPVQVVHREAPCEVEGRSLAALPAGEREREVERLRREDARRGFALDRPDPPRVLVATVAPDEHRILTTFHYLRVDGWSAMLSLGRLREVYDACRSGGAIRPAEARASYGDFARWLQRQDRTGAERFWRDWAAEAGPPPAPPAGWIAGGPEPELRRTAITLSAGESEALRAVCREHRITLASLFQAAWAALLAQRAGSGTVCFGVALSGRPPEVPGIEEMIGPFLNILPFLQRVPAGATLLELAERVQRRMADLTEVQHTPIDLVRRWWSLPPDRPAFETYFVFQNLPGMRDDGGEGANLTQTEYPIRLEVWARDRLELAACYLEGPATPEDVRGLLDGLRRVARGAASVGPRRPVRELC